MTHLVSDTYRVPQGKNSGAILSSQDAREKSGWYVVLDGGGHQLDWIGADAGD